MDLEAVIFDDQVPDEFMSMGSDALRSRVRLLANEIRVLKVPISDNTATTVSSSSRVQPSRLEPAFPELVSTQACGIMP